MRIAFFLDISKGLGGAGNLLLQQAVLMSEIHSVVVVIPIDENEVPNEEYAKRCRQNKIRYIGMNYNTAYSFTTIDFSAAMESTQAIEKFALHEKIDFFHSVQLNIAVEYVSRKLKIPNLMNIYSIHQNEFKLCRHDIYPKYHLCDSRIYSDIWRKNLNIISKCIRPIALLKNIKKKQSYRSKTIKMVVVGNVGQYKNQLTAIKAFEKCMGYNSNIELHVLGSTVGAYAEECIRYVKDNMLNTSVFFHGFVSDVSQYLETMDCILCASTRESFPLSIVEALTYDLTVISTPVAGVPEVFVNKENAFISKDFSQESISESIAECLEYYKNGRINEIHENAFKTWQENFEREYVKQAMDLYYKEIMAQDVKNDIGIFSEIEQKVKEIEKYINDSVGVVGDQKPYFSHGLYYLIIKEKLSKGRIYIWGAGKRGIKAYHLLRCLCPDLIVEAFADGSKEGVIDGIPIIKTEILPISKEYFYCISFVAGTETAICFLEEKGLTLNEQVWLLP